MISRRHAWLFVAAVAAIALHQRTARAQDARLEGRLTPATAAAVRFVIDSAHRSSDLPDRSLVDKALEAKAKGASDSAIVAAVRRYSTDLTRARTALGHQSTAIELEAGAAVLEAGVSSRDLARIRTAAPKRVLSRPLLVLGDLVAQQVPVASSMSVIITLLRAGVADSDLMAFQASVRGDIVRGADPAAAANARARGAVVGRDRYIPMLAY